MRTKNSIRNSLVAIIQQIIILCLSFFVRTIFIKVLGVSYLGINGLFSNILSMLSLAELGVGSAIIYSMYKPMAENNTEKVRILIRVYGKIYKLIGSIILIAGFLLVPFLDLLIKNRPSINHLELYFIITVINTASSYFLMYKASLFIVAQKEYIVSIIRTIFIIVKYSLEIIVIIYFKSYLVYLLVSLFTTLVSNTIISLKADIEFPFIKDKTKTVLAIEEKSVLKKNISALFFHRIGNVVVNGTDNIIISKMFGIATVGLYSNYLLIIMSINTFINLIYNSLTASVGNLNASENKEKSYAVYKNIIFSNFWIGGFSAISLAVLLNPFIILWVGNEYTLNNYIVIVIVVNSYFTFIRKTTLVFRDAMGLFWKDRYKPLVESLINLVFSIVLANKIGLIGVFLGTLISTLSTCFWIEPWILFKYGFDRDVKEYFQMFAQYFAITLLAGIVTFMLANILSSETLFTLLYKMAICIIVPNLLNIFLLKKKKEFQYFKNLIRSTLSRIFKPI